MRHELSYSGPKHASGEWATVHENVVIVRRETQEEPETGNQPTFSDIVE